MKWKLIPKTRWLVILQLSRLLRQIWHFGVDWTKTLWTKDLIGAFGKVRKQALQTNTNEKFSFQILKRGWEKIEDAKNRFFIFLLWFFSQYILGKPIFHIQ